jgi:flavin reductase (DIM6/NTAB) family NADH-FMN oxidoreductase RutF
MFYRPADGHGLPHNPFNAIVTPRPIGWISTTGAMGDNLAPYSFFNAVAYTPPQVMFASVGIKDSLLNVRETGVFAVNIVGEAMLMQMSETSAMLPRGTDEFMHSGVEKADCTTIPCPRVKHAPATLECRLTQEVALLGHDNVLILGEVTGIHLNDACLQNGRFDPTLYHPVARMGYRDYAVVREVLEVLRPGER